MLWNNMFRSMKKNNFFRLNSFVYHKFESGSSKTVDIFPVKHTEDENSIKIPKKCCES